MTWGCSRRNDDRVADKCLKFNHTEQCQVECALIQLLILVIIPHWLGWTQEDNSSLLLSRATPARYVFLCSEQKQTTACLRTLREENKD